MRINSTTLRAAAIVISGGLAAQVIAAQGANGLSTVRAQRFVNPNLIFTIPEAGDEFADAFAVGDFNGDGVDDLATGIPFDDGFAAGVGEIDQGAVLVRHGVHGHGLAQNGPAFLMQDGTPPGTPDSAEEGDQFGRSLAACDFNADGFDDLAVGVPGENHLGVPNAGAVQIHYGSPSGLPAFGEQFFTQSTPGIPGDIEANDAFGRALACGDFDADGFADLAIGTPSEGLGGEGAAGLVTLLYGTAFGLDTQRASDLELASPSPAAGFGSAFGVGDFNGDGFADLAVGAPGHSSSSGLVRVHFGGPFGLSDSMSTIVRENNVGGQSEPADRFGESLAVGDFDGDGFDDLAIGVPQEDLGGGNAIVDAGQIAVVHGGSGGVNFVRARIWTHSQLFFPGTDEPSDFFGLSIVALDFDADGFDDLAVGRPGESILSQFNGAVTWWMGSPIIGLFSVGRVRDVSAGLAGFPGPALQEFLSFGRTLASGDFDDDSCDDLVIGSPREDVGGLEDIGSELVLFGSLFSDGFESADLGGWSSVLL